VGIGGDSWPVFLSLCFSVRGGQILSDKGLGRKRGGGRGIVEGAFIQLDHSQEEIPEECRHSFPLIGSGLFPALADDEKAAGRE